MSVPLPLLFAKPERVQLRVSPMGGWVTWLERDAISKVLNLWLRRWGEGSAVGGSPAPAEEGRQVTFADDRDICSFFTFSLDDKYLLYLRDTSNGNEFYHLHALDLESDDPWATRRDLIKDPKMTVAMGFIGNVQIWRPAATPREILLATGRGSLFWEVSRLNLDTGDLQLVENNLMATCWGPFYVLAGVIGHWMVRVATCGTIRSTRAPAIPAVQWFPDRQDGFKMRGRTQLQLVPEISAEWAVRSPRGRWEPVQSAKLIDLNLQLVGATGGAGTARMEFDGDVVELHSCLERDTTSYGRYRCQESQGFKEEKLLAWSPQVDIAGFMSHPSTGKCQAVVFEKERIEVEVLDSEIEPDLALLRGRFPDADVSVIDRSRSDHTWILCVSGDCSPGEYYFYDRPRQAMTFAFDSRPKLRGLPLAQQRPVHVRATDGEDLLCYLSRPAAPEGPPPLVLWIHGGPMARDSWGFDPEVQLLCSRGMAVLQVNYRSSAGFGKRFLQLPYGKLDTVRQDVEDAAQWAIQAGVGDPARIAIGGGSWGGYLTLRAMTTNPGLFACGVAMVPVSSIGATGGLSFRGDPLIKTYYDKMYGPEVAKDKKAAKAISPLYHADKIMKPLMVVTGLKDPRVKPEQGAAIIEALKSRDVPCYFVSYPDEGHGLRKERNILDCWKRTEHFLCQELSLPLPPLLDDSWTEGSSAIVQWDSIG